MTLQDARQDARWLKVPTFLLFRNTATLSLDGLGSSTVWATPNGNQETQQTQGSPARPLSSDILNNCTNGSRHWAKHWLSHFILMKNPLK